MTTGFFGGSILKDLIQSSLDAIAKVAKERNVVINVSGGKDSQTVLALALTALKNRKGKKIHANFMDTGFEHPDTYKHLKYMEQRYAIRINRLRSRYGDMYSLIRHFNDGERNSGFPNGRVRYCTQRLKQGPSDEWLLANNLASDSTVMLIGIRTEESSNRASRYGGISPSDMHDYGDLFPGGVGGIAAVQVAFPIIHWPTRFVFAYLKARGDKVNPLYKRGASRVGCFPCLLSGYKDIKFALSDKYGIENLRKMVKLQDEINATGKNVSVHRTIPIKQIIANQDSISRYNVDDDEGAGCAMCNI